MKTRFRTLTIATAILASLSLAACGTGTSSTRPTDGSWDDVVAAANKEGSVLLYSSQKPANLEALKASFEAKYPQIKMEFVRGTDADINPRVEIENRIKKGTADVHMVTDAAWIKTASDSGAYSTELVGPSLASPAYEPEKSVINNRFFLTSAAVFALGWNATSVPQGLESPRDILKPEYTGKIGIVNPAGIASYVDLYRYYSKTFGEDYWEKLAALKPRVFPSAIAIGQALASGEVVVAPAVQPLVAEIAAGAPVGWALPENPWGTPWYSHVLSVAPHPNAAQVLADFMVTQEGQTALNKGYAATLPDIPGAVARAQDIKSPDTADLTPERIKEYSRQWEKMFLS
ncbi:ABC transporter substrate-binding protein [Nocardia vinacea]|uniref:ABC transporter substrate-binding protein n=1 Tax=Nocardia vinacea TaxID=96468 RepID=UPI0002D6E9D3|nr:substrate-binding domain-containing protein [Nocardia vinacea]